MNPQITTLICGILGWAFMALSRAQSIKKDIELTNNVFNLRKYIKGEYLGLIMGLIPIALWYLTRSEVTTAYPKLSGREHISFGLVGALGTWIFSTVLGATKGWFRKVVDIKTDIADGKRTP